MTVQLLTKKGCFFSQPLMQEQAQWNGLHVQLDQQAPGIASAHSHVQQLTLTATPA
jgi:hypothetical protein